MKKVVTYGSFDYLHYGHIRLLERAKKLGDYLIVGITSEDFDKKRGKINVQQSLMERIEAVRSTGIADEIIVEEYAGQKIDDIKRYDIDIFAIGSDWAGKFDYLNEYCQVVYLDRTEGVSSSEIRADRGKLRLGLIGSVPLLAKVASECAFVNGVELAGFMCKDDEVAKSICEVGVSRLNSLEEICEVSDALYIVSPPQEHYHQVLYALKRDKHVLCEAPLALRTSEYEKLHSIAAERGLVLQDALRTAYSTAYDRLLLLLKSGHIGKVVSVDAVCTSLRMGTAGNRQAAPAWNSICTWGPTAMLPVFQILGTDFQGKRIFTHIDDQDNDADTFTCIGFQYRDSIASVKIGNGAKSEGQLVVSGTKGYAFVPTPWWKTDYFEIRYEDSSRNERYYYALDGEGIRYEVVSFCQAVSSSRTDYHIQEDVSRAIVGIIEDFYAGRDIVKLADGGHGFDTSGEEVSR